MDAIADIVLLRQDATMTRHNIRSPIENKNGVHTRNFTPLIVSEKIVNIIHNYWIKADTGVKYSCISFFILVDYTQYSLIYYEGMI